MKVIFKRMLDGSATVFLVLQTVLGLCVAPPVVAGIEFCRRVVMSDLESMKLPITIRVSSATAVIRETPHLNGPSVDRLANGAEVTAISFAEGDSVGNNCQESPYERCIEESKVWLLVSFKNAKGEQRRGYCSLINFQAFEGLESQSKDFGDLFHLDKRAKFGVLWGSEVRNWKLPGVTKRSFLDQYGWQNSLPKIVTPAGEAIVSRMELEYFGRLSHPDSMSKFCYSGKAKRLPEHWTHFPPAIQAIHFEPSMKALLVFKNYTQFIDISYLEARYFFSGYPRFRGNSIPIVYKIPLTLNNPLLIVLLTYRAHQFLKNAKIAVNSTVINSPGESTLITTIDLNDDGQPEIVRFHTEVNPGAFKEGDEYNDDSSTQLAMLHEGSWYITAMKAKGQDGLEGF